MWCQINTDTLIKLQISITLCTITEHSMWFEIKPIKTKAFYFSSLTQTFHLVCATKKYSLVIHLQYKWILYSLFSFHIFFFCESKLVTTQRCFRYLTAGYVIESDIKYCQRIVVVIKEIVLFEKHDFSTLYLLMCLIQSITYFCRNCSILVFVKHVEGCFKSSQFIWSKLISHFVLVCYRLVEDIFTFQLFFLDQIFRSLHLKYKRYKIPLDTIKFEYCIYIGQYKC